MFKRKYSLNEKIFDDVNNNSAYWIGLLYADGSCTMENKIRLWIHPQDIDILKQMKDFLRSTDRPIKEKISKDGKRYVGIEVRSWRIHNKIKKFELTTIKPNRHRINIELLQPEIRKNFVRGIFDGDGSFYVDQRGYLFCEIAGYMPLLKDIKNILVVDGIISEKNKIVKSGSIFRIRLSASHTLKFGYYIYNNAQYYIRRKFNLFKSHAERLNNIGDNKYEKLYYLKR